MSGNHLDGPHAATLPSGNPAAPYLPQADRSGPPASSLPVARIASFLRPAGSDPPVAVSSTIRLFTLTHTYAFNCWYPAWAHPAGEYRARIAFLRQLAAVDDPTRFAHLARRNDFSPIDGFVLRKTPDGLRHRTWSLQFPYDRRKVEITFDRQQFAPAQWQTTDVGDYLVIARR